MSEGGEPSAPATPGLIPLSYTTPWDAARRLYWQSPHRRLHYALQAGRQTCCMATGQIRHPLAGGGDQLLSRWCAASSGVAQFSMLHNTLIR